MVAFTRWYFPYTLTEEQRAAGAGVFKVPESWPEGSDVEVCEEFWTELYKGRNENMRGGVDYCLSSFSFVAAQASCPRHGLLQHLR
jgi:hypothetical protein